MPILTGSISDADPLAGFALIGAAVGVRPSRAAQLKRIGAVTPAPVRCQAMLDPGSAYTLVHAPVIQSLGLTQPVRPMAVYTPSTGGSPILLDGFNVSLTILHPSGDVRSNLVMRSFTVGATQLDSFDALGIQVVVGSDAQAGCLFFYDGLRKHFTLAF
jgi:hypothetical protein